MPFRFLRQAHIATAACLIVAFSGLTGCNRAASREEKALRAELQQALQDRAYEKAAELARRHLKLKPQDNGTWDRLVRAQFGMRDLAGVKQTLEEWRRAVPKPSLTLDQYAGDLAAEQKEWPLAVESWTKVVAAEPENSAVLEKIARAEKLQKRWQQENDAWTAHINARDNAIARINRALCRRRLHRWQDAFDDLQRAQALAPDDPEVQQGARLLEKMGRFLADIRELDSSLAVTPDDPGLLADRALVFLRSEDFELALESAEAARKFGPWAQRPKLFQALALIDLGRAEECEALAVHRQIRLEALTPEFLETMGRLDSEISAERNNAEL